MYINSLCGYYITNSYPESCNPHSLTDKSGHYYGALFKVWCGTQLSANSEHAGMEGDIDSYSKHINNYFYNLLANKQASGELSAGGIGVVLMDRVSNNAEADPAGYYIPQIIWTNNTFKSDNE